MEQPTNDYPHHVERAANELKQAVSNFQAARTTFTEVQRAFFNLRFTVNSFPDYAPARLETLDAEAVTK